jgi:uncharacterized membrane protein YbhN (UPF0104 family)
MKDFRFGHKRNMFSLVLLIASILICFWIVYFYRDLFSRIFDISLQYVIILSALFIIVQLTSGYKLFLVVRSFGPKMEMSEWIGLPYFTSYFNYLPGNAGSGMTAVFLKKRYDLPYTKFLSMSGALFVIYLLCFSTAGIFLMGLLWIKTGYSDNYIITVLFSILLFVAFCRFFPVHLTKQESRVLNWLRSILIGFDDLRKNSSLIKNLIVCSYLQIALLGAIIYSTFLALGIKVDPVIAFLLGVITSIAKFQFLVPGQFGIREIFFAFVTKLLDGSFGEGMVVAVTDRVVSGVITIILGNFFTWAVIDKSANLRQSQGTVNGKN